jgi:hypothetical protein
MVGGCEVKLRNFPSGGDVPKALTLSKALTLPKTLTLPVERETASVQPRQKEIWIPKKSQNHCYKSQVLHGTPIS